MMSLGRPIMAEGEIAVVSREVRDGACASHGLGGMGGEGRIGFIFRASFLPFSYDWQEGEHLKCLPTCGLFF